MEIVRIVSEGFTSPVSLMSSRVALSANAQANHAARGFLFERKFQKFLREFLHVPRPQEEKYSHHLPWRLRSRWFDEWVELIDEPYRTMALDRFIVQFSGSSLAIKRCG